MKEGLSGIIVFMSCMVACAQAEFNLWNESLLRCAQIKSGSYAMTYRSNYLMSSDTVFKSAECVFKRDPSDTVFGFYFDSERTIGTLPDFYTYTGSYFISGSKKEAMLFQNREGFGEVRSQRHNYDFFTPLTNFQQSEMAGIDTGLLEFVGEEKIGRYATRHYRYSPVEDPEAEIQILRSELNFWIHAEDAVPVRYSVYYQVDLAGDTLDQYDEYSLISYSLNGREKHAFKTPDVLVKEGFHLQEFTPNRSGSVERLALGSKVPDWKFETNQKTILSSGNQSYKLVLFDFYYQSCYPCLKSIPFLNELSEKYHLNGKGLLVVGINTTDPVDDRFYEFIAKKEIRYPVAVNSNPLNREFNVSAYPSIFLMNSRGELIHFSEGYSKESEAQLEELIIKELKK